MRFMLPGVVAVLSLWSAENALACSCMGQSPCRRYAAVSAVFLGEVLDTSIRGDMLVARMRVTRVWKGIVDGVVTVSNEAHSSCSFEFAAGERYVVYGGGDSRQFRTSVCSGGWQLAPDDPEPELPPAGGRVSGQVLRFNQNFTSREDLHSPIVGIRVFVDDGNAPIEAHTDGDGAFVLDGVPAGKHIVRADLGPGAEGAEPVMLESASDCAVVVISAEPSGLMAGTIVAGDGSPLENIKVSAVPLDHDWSKTDLTGVRDAASGKDGAFEFTSMKAGQYVIGVNLFDLPKVSQPFPPTFYPNAASRNDATIVTVADGKVELEPLVLNQTLPRTVIFADIICRDGSVPRSGLVYAARADGSSYFDESSYEKIDGRIRLSVMKGVVYDVRGEVLVPFVDPSGRHHGITSQRTPSVRIDSDSPPAVVHLIAPRDRCQETTIDGSKP